MSNEIADAVRREMYDRVRSKYGDLTNAADQLGVPYNTLRRALNPKAIDRSKTVTLELVIEISAKMVADGYPDDFPAIYAAALRHVR